jgi:hypothetical protein
MMYRARNILTALIVGLSSSALAGPFDGLYRPNFEWAQNWNCTSVGMDGGAVAVWDDRLLGVENSCDLTGPVDVNGMSAVLYDAVCTGEGETYSYRVMLMKHASGIYVVSDGQVADWVRCPN